MKHILITGAAGGLGSALTEQCLAHSHRVTGLHGRNTRPIRPKEEMNGDMLEIDLLDSEATTGACKAIAQKPWDAFVHLAAAPLDLAPFSKQTWGQFENQLRVTLQSAVLLTQAILPGMRQRRSGHLIYCLSAATLGEAPKGMASYTSAKYALLGLARSIASECKGTGIFVTCVSPGPMHTQLLRLLPEVAKNQLREHAADHQWLDPASVARAILHILEHPDPSLHDAHIPMLSAADTERRP